MIDKGRFLLISIVLLIFLSGFINGNRPGGYGYRWVIFETIPRDKGGAVTGKPIWQAPLRIKSAEADSFVVYGNNDSIRMTTPGSPDVYLFSKMPIASGRWKPRPNYGNKLFFMGTFGRKDLPGMFISFYATKDRSSLMQLYYTNPGNIQNVLLFAKDSVNVLAEAGLVIDPRDESTEPERAKPASR